MLNFFHLRSSSVYSSNPPSESDLLQEWQFTTNQFVLVTSPLRPMTRIFIFQVTVCGYRAYVRSSLMRGWVCPLQLLLGLASTVILRSKSHGTNDHILPSQIQDSPSLEGQVHVLLSPRNRVARLYPPGTGFPFCHLLRLAGLQRRYLTTFHTKANSLIPQ
jgi:hypothetical protein